VQNPVTEKLPPKLNAATHWMTSRQPLIPGESPEALQAHLEHWNNLYPDVETDELLSDLVCEAAFSSWLLIRSQRQYDASLAILHAIDMDLWTPEQNKTYQLRERYLNAAHRRLNRHRSDVVQYQSNLRAQAREYRAASDYAEKQAAKTPKTKEPAPGPPKITDRPYPQGVYVSQKNGVTRTYLNPSNEFLLNDVAGTRYETSLVFRCIEFKDHVVPPEYEAFAERAAQLKGLPRIGNIKLPITFRSLRVAVEREKELGGHIREWPDLRAQDEEFIQKFMREQNNVSEANKAEEEKRPDPGGRSMV
jgi:hypothetical protein